MQTCGREGIAYTVQRQYGSGMDGWVGGWGEIIVLMNSAKLFLKIEQLKELSAEFQVIRGFSQKNTG